MSTFAFWLDPIPSLWYHQQVEHNFWHLGTVQDNSVPKGLIFQLAQKKKNYIKFWVVGGFFS
jgi:hypothetical protein